MSVECASGNDVPSTTSLSFLEVGFPYAEVSTVARADRFGRDVLYAAHKWWARRPPSIIRALLLASILPAHTTPEAFWELYGTDSPLLDGLHVGDPFMGGATTLVEAARLGASVTGTDVDPLAVLIAQEELAPTGDPQAYASAARDLLAYMYECCGALYAAGDSEDTPLHYFWLRIVTCPKCDMESLLYRTPVLARDSGKKGAVVRTRGSEVFCPHCRVLHHLPEDAQTLWCCDQQHDLNTGTFMKGAYTCPNCGDRRKHDQLKTNQLPRALIAIETTSKTGRRRFRSPTRDDHSCITTAQGTVSQFAEFIPIASLDGVDYGRPKIYGIETVADLFSPRQQIVFATAFQWLAKQELSEGVRRRLRLALSNALSANNVLCGYATDYGRLAPLFAGLRSYAMPVLSVELNPLHPSAGRGTFAATLRRVQRSLTEKYRRYVLNPQSGETEWREFTTRRISHSHVACRSANTGLPRDLGACNVIVTDPPYFDYIAYSDLSLVCRAWLWTDSGGALGGKPIYPIGEDPVGTFGTQLGRAFGKAKEALTPDGILIFTFHSTNPNAWDSLADALQQAKIRVSAVFPVWSDARAAAHAHPGNCEWDLVFVCRPVDANIAADLHFTVSAWLDKLDHASSPAGKDLISLGLGLETAQRVNDAKA